MESFKGKKLLILGGHFHSIEIVQIAKELGLYTIVTDWNDIEHSPAKKYADESWQISLLDYDTLSTKIKENCIDGIITGFADSYLVPYATICDKVGLPSYATAALFAKVHDKSLFKKMCLENGVPVVPEYDIENFDPNILSKSNKVIIKPVDNSGSRGIVICDDPDTFSQCLKHSLDFSVKKQVIIEKYLELDSVSISYTLQDGVASLTTMNDDFLYQEGGVGGVNCGGLYPSKYTDFYIEKIDKQVKAMFKQEDFKNGVLFMQAFTNGDEFYFFEMGYRLSGGRHYVLTENQNGTSSLKQLIHFAITGNMADYCISEKDNPRFNSQCYRFNLIGTPGKVKKIEGIDFLESREEVIYYNILKREGDEIGQPGTTASQVLCSHIVVNNSDEFIFLIEEIYDKVRFLDEDDKNLIIKIAL